MAISWDSEKDLLFNLLFPRILAAAMAGAENSLGSLVDMGVGVDWALVNTAVQEWARQYAYDLVTKITDTTRRFVQETVAAWIESGAPLDDLIDSLAPMFGSVRAEMIAVTEITRAFAEGNMALWSSSGVVSGKQWMTANDELVCPICGVLDGNVVALDADFDDGSFAPPAHVRCRCWMQPVVRA